MKIALVYHESGIPGGHCEYSDVLLKGLRENGAEVDFFYISPNKQDTSNRVKVKDKLLNSTGGVDEKGNRYTYGENVGCYYHSETGFVTEKSLYGDANLTKRLRSELDQYDAIIWQDLGGFKNPHNEIHTDWLSLVKRRSGQKQIAMFHDHGAFLRYPWFDKIQDQFDFLICVHPASYNMGANFSIPRCMILNPQVIDSSKVIESNWKNRDKKTTMAIGAWKGSKKMHEVVMAVPWMDRDIVIDMCGDGTERRYLAATDKCKPSYIRTKLTDPSFNKETMGLDDDRFWVHAHNHPGFTWRGPVDSVTRDKLYSDCFMFIDPAWYSVNKKIDAHFSRVIVEAMKNGIVPFARDLGLGYGDGTGSMFKAGHHYINIPWDATPKQFGTIINDTINCISEDQYETIVSNNLKLVSDTDYRLIGAQFIDAILGSDIVGYYGKWETGASNSKFKEASDKQWYGESKGFCFKR